MDVLIRTQGVELTSELREYIERKLSFALDRHQERLPQVEVFLSDVNGPRGGVDKICQMTASLRGTRRVQILEQSGELYEGINRAARRLAFRLGQEIRRIRTPGLESVRLSA